MPQITHQQQAAIRAAHTLGLTDAEAAAHAGVSVSTVKRHRGKMGLQTKSRAVQLGKKGESLLTQMAQARGLTTQPRLLENDPYDLIIEGQLVDVKTTEISSDGSWKFHLPRQRTSFYGQYTYPKNYSADCDVIALVCLKALEDPDVYFLPSGDVPTLVEIRSGGRFASKRNDWSLLLPASAAAA